MMDEAEANPGQPVDPAGKSLGMNRSGNMLRVLGQELGA